MTLTQVQHLTREELETEVTMLQMMLRRASDDTAHWQRMVMEHAKLSRDTLHELEQAKQEVQDLKLALEAKIRLIKIEEGP